MPARQNAAKALLEAPGVPSLGDFAGASPPPPQLPPPAIQHCPLTAPPLPKLHMHGGTRANPTPKPGVNPPLLWHCRGRLLFSTPLCMGGKHTTGIRALIWHPAAPWSKGRVEGVQFLNFFLNSPKKSSLAAPNQH